MIRGHKTRTGAVKWLSVLGFHQRPVQCTCIDRQTSLEKTASYQIVTSAVDGVIPQKTSVSLTPQGQLRGHPSINAEGVCPIPSGERNGPSIEEAEQ